MKDCSLLAKKLTILSFQALDLEDIKWVKPSVAEELSLINTKARKLLKISLTDESTVASIPASARLIYSVKQSVGLEIITSSTGLFDEDFDRVIVLGRMLYNQEVNDYDNNPC